MQYSVGYVCPCISDKPVYFVHFADGQRPMAQPNLDVLDIDRDHIEMFIMRRWMPELLGMVEADMRKRAVDHNYDVCGIRRFVSFDGGGKESSCEAQAVA